MSNPFRKKTAAATRFLPDRQPDLIEWMDRADCDPVKLHNTYRYFPVINRLISRWRAVYRHFIRPHLVHGTVFRLLDVGSGGGDIAKNIHRWALHDGFRLDVTGIDPDPRALEFAHAAEDQSISNGGSTDVAKGHNPDTSGLRFLQTDTARLRKKGETYDFVICNHVLHHLPETDIAAFLEDLAALAGFRVICSDIERSAVGYVLFSVATWPLFPNSYIRADGLISIKKSFRPQELREILPDEWRVVRQFPYRLLAVLDK